MPVEEAREHALVAERYVRDSPRKAARAAAQRVVSEEPSQASMGRALLDALDAAVRCRRCGRKLKDPVSVARHIGPECVTREGVAA